MLSLPVLALLFPLYRAEYLLGFVLGMCFTFGVIIPIGVGTLVLLMSFSLHKTPRPLLRYVVNHMQSTQRSNSPFVAQSVLPVVFPAPSTCNSL